MAEETGQERTEEASPRRLEKAREEGNIPRSHELNTFALLAAGGAVLTFLAQWLSLQLEGLMRFGLRIDGSDLAPQRMLERFALSLWQGVEASAPVMAALMLAALLAPMAVSGWLFTTKLLAFKASRLSPLQGIKRVFSLHGLMELVKAVVKVVLLGALVYWVLASRFNELMFLAGSGSFKASLSLLWDTLVATFWALVGGVLVIVLADVPFALWNYSKSLRMTKQEVIEEQKETNLSPEVRQRIRQAQRAAAERRMMEAVPTAQVVVVNPTEYAVALKYDQGKDQAPIIVAKGVDEVAERIRELAKDNDIPIVSAPPLARALYNYGSLDKPIPGPLYKATSLVFVYLNALNRALASGSQRPELPVVWEVPPEMDGAT